MGNATVTPGTKGEAKTFGRGRLSPGIYTLFSSYLTLTPAIRWF
jgi:hypothetical protein